MSNALQLLEMLGRVPVLARDSAEAHVETIATADIDGKQREALQARDIPALAKLLGGNARMFCMIVAPDEQSPERIPDDQDDRSEPDQENDPDSTQ